MPREPVTAILLILALSLVGCARHKADLVIEVAPTIRAAHPPAAETEPVGEPIGEAPAEAPSEAELEDLSWYEEVDWSEVGEVTVKSAVVLLVAAAITVDVLLIVGSKGKCGRPPCTKAVLVLWR